MNTPQNKPPSGHIAASWVDFVGGSRMKLHNQLAIEVQQGKMPNAPWHWYGVGGISRADFYGGCQTIEDAKSQAIEHARRELTAALIALPNAERRQPEGAENL